MTKPISSSSRPPSPSSGAMRTNPSSSRPQAAESRGAPYTVSAHVAAPAVAHASVPASGEAPEAPSGFDPETRRPTVPLTGAGGGGPHVPTRQRTVSPTRTQDVTRIQGPSSHPSITLALHNSVTDEKGGRHDRMKLFHEGVAVFQGQVIHHFDKNGKQTRVTGDLPSIPEGLGSGPVNLSETQAREKARERCKEPLRSETAERVVVRADDGKYHAAWNVKLSKSNRTEADGEARDVAYLVDANTGEFLKVGHKDEWEPYSPASHEENANTSAHSSQSDPSGRAKKRSVPVKASGHTQYSGPVDFIAARKADDTYKLKDSTRNIVTYDAENKSFDRQRYGSKEGKKAFIGKKHDPWDDSKTNNYTQVALDVHYGTQMMYDFMKDVLGRDSIDGKGGKLISHVHVNEGDGTPFKQAMWLDDRMVYGDGDGVKTKSYTPVEIVGHELTHGLNMHTANMVGGGETAALNESISDIMGAGLKWYVSQRNPEVKFNWKNGEKVIGPDWDVEALRHMDTPKKGERLNGQKGYVDHLDGFKPEGYVYFNTGIASNAFYLLAEGGKNSTSGLGVEGGIGMERALKIFGRALITEMRPNEDFQGARRATLQAATDLYGADSVEVRKLGEAWTAVGVKASS